MAGKPQTFAKRSSSGRRLRPGLDISDEQQVTIAKTLGNLVQNEGESGIYKISFDKNVNQKADYLKGSMFWHFDG